MSKEMELLKSKMEFYKRMINELDYMNFITKSNKFDNKIEKYQDILADVYIKYRELKENEKWKSK